MPRTKRFAWAKKFFSRNTPGYPVFYPRKSTKSIVRKISEKTPVKASIPRKYSEPQTGGEPLAFIKTGGSAFLSAIQRHCPRSTDSRMCPLLADTRRSVSLS